MMEPVAENRYTLTKALFAEGMRRVIAKNYGKTAKRAVLALLLCLVMLLALVACDNSGSTKPTEDNTKTVADDIVNGDFEDVSSGQWVGWTRKDAAFNFRGVTDVEKVNGAPMEKSGTYYFAGTVGGNPAMRGTLTSDPFKLGGTGFISFKMGGTGFISFKMGGCGFISVRMGGAAAAVHVFKADGTEIGYYKQTRFHDEFFPSVGAGGSWADMGSYVIDLSDHIGEELCIVLADELIEGGWAHGFFDEIVTFYEEAPDYANLADTVLDGAAGEDPHNEIQIPWELAVNELG